MMKFNIVIIISLCLLFSTRADVGAFDDLVTHPAITEAAIELKSSTLNQFIKDNIGCTEGIDLPVRGILQIDVKDKDTGTIIKKGEPFTQPVSEWLKDGSIAEDSPLCRAANHFHNPLKSWDQSGSYSSSILDDPYAWSQQKYCGPENIYSAITWATGFTSKEDEKAGKEVQFANPIFTEDPTRAPNNWSNARDKYYRAFTELTQDSRDKYLASSLVTLGQVVHLLEDMGVPAHTRNDFESHMFLTLPSSFDCTKWVYQPFERYVERNTNTNKLLVDAASKEVSDHPSDYTPLFSDPSLTKFWDTDQYTGQNPSITKETTNIGLAEFSNANYLSDYTIPSNSPTVDHQFPNPKIDNSYHICEEPLLGIERRYVSRKEKA